MIILMVSSNNSSHSVYSDENRFELIDTLKAPIIQLGELMESLDPSMSPLFDQSIEDLIAQSLIHSSDGENFQITRDGINESENRKRESIPL
jgi:hypothetical protein